jgi:hypothetical protein
MEEGNVDDLEDLRAAEGGDLHGTHPCEARAALGLIDLPRARTMVPDPGAGRHRRVQTVVRTVNRRARWSSTG